MTLMAVDELSLYTRYGHMTYFDYHIIFSALFYIPFLLISEILIPFLSKSDH